MEIGISGKVAIVTGGSQGIGAAMVALARTAGHQVVFTGRNEALIDKVAQATAELESLRLVK